jgi:hypothetical protein
MLALQDIEKEVISLSKNKYSDFRKWFYSYDFEHWDNEIKEDSKSGKLDFLIKEVLEEKTLGELKSL